MARPPVSAASDSSTSTRRAGEHELRAARGQRARDRLARHARAGRQPVDRDMVRSLARGRWRAARPRSGARGQAKTATVAVKPCRNVLAADRADLAGREEPGGRGAARAPRPRPRRRGRARRTARGRGRCRRTAAHPPACARRAPPSGRRAPRAGRGRRWRRRARAAARPGPRGRGAPTATCPVAGIGADEPAHEEVALARSRACCRRPRCPAAARPGPARGRCGGSASIVSRSFSSAGLPASSWMTWPVGGGDGELRPDRRGALRDAGQQLDAVEPDADGAVVDHAVAEEQRGGAARVRAPTPAPPSTGTAGGGRPGSASTRVGRERRGVGEQDRAGGAGERRAARRARRCPRRAPRRSAWNVVALPPPRAPPRRRPPCRPRPRAAPPSTPPAPQPTSTPGASASRTASSIASGAAGGAGGEDDHEVARLRRPGPRAPSVPPRSRPRAIRARREAGADADGHRAPTILRGRCSGRPVRASPCSGRPASARPPSRSRSPTGCAPRGEDPVAVSADALQVYAGLETLTGVPTRGRARALEHRLVSFLPVDATVQRRRVRASSPTPRSTALLAAGRGRSSSAAPACTCAPRSPSSSCARPSPPDDPRALARRSSQRTARRRCTPSSRARAPWPPPRSSPNDRHRIVRALELLDAGELEPPDAAQPAVDRPTPATRRCSSA